MSYLRSFRGFEKRVVLRTERWLPRHIDREIDKRFEERADKAQARKGFSTACRAWREAE